MAGGLASRPLSSPIAGSATADFDGVFGWDNAGVRELRCGNSESGRDNLPVYEYGCEACGIIEVEQRITEAKLESCPVCVGPVKRLISSTHFALLGTGWFTDGYGKVLK